MLLTEPLRVTNTTESYDIDATIDGGGISGQAGAMRLGIARSLCEMTPSTAPASSAPASSPATPVRRSRRSTA
jgi:small subunit ribosomal protein S9